MQVLKGTDLQLQLPGMQRQGIRRGFVKSVLECRVEHGSVVRQQEYHVCYCEVAPEFATPSCPAYRAPGGSSGTLANASVCRRIAHVRRREFVRYDNLPGAVFTDSPLLESRHSVMTRFDGIYILKKSSGSVTSSNDVRQVMRGMALTDLSGAYRSR